MGVLEKITANMELTELKKFKLQKAILALMLEWKQLEEYMDSTQHSFQECLDELQLKEKYLNSVQESALKSNKEMESIRVSIEGRIKELDDKEREFQVFRDEQVNELDLKAKQLGLIGKSIEERIKLVELREEKLAAKKKIVEGIFEEFKVEEKHFEDIRKSVEERLDEINSKGMQLEQRSKELDCVQDWIEIREKELDAKEEDIEKRCKELESKEKEQFFIRMDGKGLQSFLNQREKDLDSMAEEVYQALRLSSDPAKLVLDAMEGFYPANPNEGNGEFEVDVVRKSCLLLLEQLLRISPQLQPHVKMEAMELLLQWKAKLSSVPDSVEVLGLLFLLASYNLPMPFDADELSALFEIVAEHRQTAELCLVLGLTDSVPVPRRVKKRNVSKSACSTALGEAYVEAQQRGPVEVPPLVEVLADKGKEKAGEVIETSTKRAASSRSLTHSKRPRTILVDEAEGDDEVRITGEEAGGWASWNDSFMLPKEGAGLDEGARPGCPWLEEGFTCPRSRNGADELGQALGRVPPIKNINVGDRLYPSYVAGQWLVSTIASDDLAEEFGNSSPSHVLDRMGFALSKLASRVQAFSDQLVQACDDKERFWTQYKDVQEEYQKVVADVKLSQELATSKVEEANKLKAELEASMAERTKLEGELHSSNISLVELAKARRNFEQGKAEADREIAELKRQLEEARKVSQIKSKYKESDEFGDELLRYYERGKFDIASRYGMAGWSEPGTN